MVEASGTRLKAPGVGVNISNGGRYALGVVAGYIAITTSKKTNN